MRTRSSNRQSCSQPLPSTKSSYTNSNSQPLAGSTNSKYRGASQQQIPEESVSPPLVDRLGTNSNTNKQTADSAADLFDSIFSSSQPSSHSSKDSNSCPDVISNDSPPPLFSESESSIKTSPNGKSVNQNLEDKKKISPTTTMISSFKYSATVSKAPNTTVKRPSPTSLSEDPYDFAAAHKIEKKVKIEEKKEIPEKKFFGSFTRCKVTYQHKWSETDDDVKETKVESKAYSATGFEMEDDDTPAPSSYTMMRKVKQANQCMESGELDDFEQDLEYITSTLFNDSATTNLRYLSAVQLAKRCVSAEFRRFLKSKGMVDKILESLSDVSASPGLSLAFAVFIYFLSRDQKCLPVNETSLRMISTLLKQDLKVTDAEFKKQSHEIWLIIQDWLHACAEKASKNMQFDLTEETLSTPFLMLEALAYVSVREHSQFFKQELLNSGCLQWVVAKFDKAVLTLQYGGSGGSSATTLLTLKEIERCYRILENAAAFNKKNQAYLINHRNGLLLLASAKFLSFFINYVKGEPERRSKSTADNSEKISMQLVDCVCLMARVLMNVSHENELCCLRVGQIPEFLTNCISTVTNIGPSYAPKEKFFDLCVMMYGLLVNVVERRGANRQKMLAMKIPFYDTDSKQISEMPTLEALTKIFVRHDSAARTLDEELDNDLAFEEPLDSGDEDESSNHGVGSSQDQNSGADNGRLNRATELSEDEMLNAVQSAMNKASAHMEDSMIASYLALFIGCLLETDEKLASDVKTWLPDKNMSAMIEQLKRFLEFMTITNLKSSANKSIERIIQSMQVAAGPNF
ncbi:wings apart-like protein regulation of heterochromatin domain-containing protein [Ditylenchus destructor]|nr:wings apart-like protein regulation of heterochromatin domain-containing protein [Ditylenchus destructor]